MRTHRSFSVVLAAAIFVGLASCSDGPTQPGSQPQSRKRALTAEDDRQSLRGAMLRIGPNEYSYSGFLADSFLQARARAAALEGDTQPLANLRAMRQRLRWPDDSARQAPEKAIARLLVPGDDPSTPPPVIVSPENTGPAVIYETAVTTEIRGTTAYVTAAVHYKGTSAGITIRRSASSFNPKYNVSEASSRQDMMGDNAYDCLVIGFTICTFDEHSSRVVELHNLLSCGMTVRANATFVAYWGLPQGSSMSGRIGYGGISLGQWGYSNERDVRADDAKNADCTAPTVAMDVHDATGHGAGVGGTLNLTAPKGGTILLMLDAQQSNTGNSDADDYSWKANDTQLASGPGALATSYYAPVGTTTITLKLTNKAGLTASGSVTVVVAEKPADPPDETGGGGPVSPPPPVPSPPGIYCWEVYHVETWFDYNTLTGGTRYVSDGVECAYVDRTPLAPGALALNVTGASGAASAGTPAAGERVAIVAVDSLPNGGSFAAVRRARRDQSDLILVNAERLTAGDLDAALRLARSVRAKLLTGTSDLVFAPRGSVPVTSDAKGVAVAQGLVASLQRAALVDVPGFGRRRAITIDLATRSVVR